MYRKLVASAVFTVAAWSASSPVAGKEFTELPDDVLTIVDGTDDGSTVVGDARIDGEIHAYLWSRTDGFVDLGFADSESHAYAVSADGTTVVGSYVNANGVVRAFVWTEATDMVDFGTAGGSTATAYDVSADGSVVVGASENEDDETEAFVWTQGDGVVGLGSLGGVSSNANSEALFVSEDGETVVGRSEDEQGSWRLFVWTQAEGMVDLGSLGGTELEVLDVSDDASVIVGTATNLLGLSLAYKWTQETDIEIVSGLTGVDASAELVSDDGTTVAGDGEFSGSLRTAFLVDAADSLSELGALVDGQASSVTSINVDGSVVGGQSGAGANLKAFLWTETSAGVESVRDLAIGAFDDLEAYDFVDVALVVNRLKFYVQVEIDGDTRFAYVELPRGQVIFDDRPWRAEIDSYVTLAYYYSYEAAIAAPDNAGAYYSFLYAYYAYLYQEIIAELAFEASNEQAMIDYYIQLRYEATVMSYYGYEYQYVYHYLPSFGTATYTTDAMTSNYYAFYYQLYDFEDLLDD